MIIFSWEAEYATRSPLFRALSSLHDKLILSQLQNATWYILVISRKHIMGPTPNPKPPYLHRSCSLDECLRRNGCHSLDVAERVCINHMGDWVNSIRKKGMEEKYQKKVFLYWICCKNAGCRIISVGFLCGNDITLSRYIPIDISIWNYFINNKTMVVYIIQYLIKHGMVYVFYAVKFYNITRKFLSSRSKV